MKRSLVSLLFAFLVLAGTADAAKSPVAGTLDRSFSRDGVVSIGEGDWPGWISAVAGTPNGKVVGGLSPGRGTKAGAVVRYLSRGGLDRSFGKRGFARLKFASGTINPTDVIVDRHGRIVVGGLAAPTGHKGFWGAVARLKRNGEPDRTFSGDGLAILPGTAGVDPEEIFFSPGGRIVMAGQTNRDAALVVRFRSNGKPDHRFSGDGRRVVRVASDQSVESLAVTPAGKVVLGLTVKKESSERRSGRVFGVVRLKPGGGMDRSFSKDGLALVNPTLDGYSDYLTDLTVDRHGRIVVVGQTNSLHSSIARLRPDGRLDLLFAQLGREGLSWMNVLGVVVDDKGRIVVSGFETPEGFEGEVNPQYPSGRLERLTGNGDYDPDFANREYFYGLGEAVLDRRNRILATASLGDSKSGIIRVRNP
jgi:uncharacterized delta-60 repeat protein